MLAGNYETDHIGSDDMEEILKLSLLEHKSHHASASFTPVSTSRPNGATQPSYLLRHSISEQIAEIEADIRGYDQEIQEIETVRALRAAERDALLEKLRQMQGGGKGKGRVGQNSIDYNSDAFDWTQELKTRMKKIFGIHSFRLCQQGVCNANMDARDIVCVMPTGGGKSLTYQLPALLTPGCTLVISPLISLITDQILHLREAGIDAVKLTGGTSKEESREIMRCLASLASRTKNIDGAHKRDIKLCYVTPEKIAKSKAFLSLLEKLESSGKLARIVIDEAHCISQLGHDFRPDYGKLSILRQLFPRVPIMALSATCPPKVLQDLLVNLKLKEVVDGSCATTTGTVYFTAPLYRKNLHYTVVPKASRSKQVIQDIANYILGHHHGKTGIVYCLTKKDAETVAEGISTESKGQIKTGVYHADVKDKDKEKLHSQWRQGTIEVVCATIAFGLGIDKGDVRFVLHHSISKSIDGFYQETGRAGRDGKDSDCVLYYRPQDATRLSSIICGELNGQQKLHDMLRFAQDLKECRKVQFAKYFSASSHLAISSWTTADSDALAPCGHCDNCTCPPENVDHKDVTIEAWQIVKICDSVHRSGQRFTVSQLAEFVRVGGSLVADTFTGGKKGKQKEKEPVEVDLDLISGEKVTMNKDHIETLMVQLLTTQYLTESFHQNSYTVIVYVVPGSQAPRLTRLSREQVANGRAPKIMCSFRNNTPKSKPASLAARRMSVGSAFSGPAREKEKGLDDELSRKVNKGEDRSSAGFFVNKANPCVTHGKQLAKKRTRAAIPVEPDDSEADRDWTYSLLTPETRKRQRRSSTPEELPREPDDPEIVIVSD